MNASRFRFSTSSPAAIVMSDAADRLRVARHERGRAVAGQLGRAPPLEQRKLDGEQRQAGEHRQPRRRAELQQDQQRRLVEDVVRVHVRGLVREHDAAAVVVEDPHELRVEHDDRLVGPDRGGVRERELGQVEVRHIVHVERVEDLPVQDPDARQLLLAEPHGRAERRRPQRALVAERHQPAHHLVEVGHLGERRAGRAVGRMLVRARRDPLELPGRFDLLGHRG